MNIDKWYKLSLFNQNVFSPWYGYGEFGEDFNVDEKARTLLSPDRMWIIYSFLKNIIKSELKGEIWECGVYKGGTSMVIANLLKRYKSDYKLCLFDTFEGMLNVNSEIDMHKKGDFSDSNYDEVSYMVNLRYDNVNIYKGFIPETFNNLNNSNISFAHVDVDIYKSVIDCCEFIWPRLNVNGIIVFDDYGFNATKSCMVAVNEFFSNKYSSPIILPTGQAFVIKNRI